MLGALVIALVVFLAGNFPLWHTDFWGHLRFGQLLSEQGFFAHELISPFSEPTAPYLHFQWLAQLLYAGVFNLGGWLAGGDAVRQLHGGVDAVRFLHALLCGLLFLLIFLGARARGATPGIATFAMIFALAFLLGTLLYSRPQLFGAIGLATLLLLVSFTPRSQWAVAGIVGVLILWANLHGSFVVGLLVLGLLLAGRGLDLLTAQNGSVVLIFRDVEFRRLLLALLLATAGSALLNPHGPMLYLYVLQFSRNPNLATVEEWHPLVFRWGFGGHLGWLFLLASVVSTRLVARTRFTWGERLLLLVFFALPFLQQRLKTWLNLLLPWLLVRLWQVIRDRLNAQGRLVPSSPSRARAAVAGVVVLFALVAQPGVRWLLRGEPAEALASAVVAPTPWELGLRWREHPPGTIFTAETGDFLFWALPAGSRVTLTTHAHLFAPAHWAACISVLKVEPGWDKILDDLKVDVVLLDSVEHPALTAAIAHDPRWRVLQAGRPFTRLFLAERRTPLDN
jgi:hypothetical protein